MRNPNLKTKKGFTLLEVLLYVSLVSMIVVTITYFFGAIITVQERNQTVLEVDQEGSFIMSKITQTIRNATSVTSPTIGSTAALLTIVVPTASKSPTTFDIVSNTFRITEGATAAKPLSSNRVVASGLTFQNLTPGSTKSVIKIQFTLTYINPDGSQSNNYSQTFQGTATLR